MRRVWNSTILLFTFPLRLLKKTKIDNFVGGLMFGAVFSLIVNIATVKVQEDLSKQRALEALETEIVFHSLTSNYFIQQENRVHKETDDEYILIDAAMSRRYKTRVFDSDKTPEYMFELDPLIAGQIETYYDFIVSNTNRAFDNNEELYKQLYRKCSLYVQIIEETEIADKATCNEISRGMIALNAGFSEQMYDNVIEIRENFHPTRDRLNSWWLRLLLGDKAYEIVKLPPNN